MLQGFNVETQRAHGVRHRFKIGLLRLVAGRRKARNTGLTAGQRRSGIIGAEHHQGAQHLFDLAIQLRQISAFGQIAKERIERRLDPAQIALDLVHHLRHQQALLRFPRHFVEQGYRRGIGGLPGEAGFEACSHRRHLASELFAESRKIPARVFGKQQGSGGFERNRLSDLVRVFRHPHGDR